jgi:hypothetical protein
MTVDVVERLLHDPPEVQSRVGRQKAWPRAARRYVNADSGAVCESVHEPAPETPDKVWNDTGEASLVVKKPPDVGEHEAHLVLYLGDLGQDALPARLADPKALQVKQHGG